MEKTGGGIEATWRRSELERREKGASLRALIPLAVVAVAFAVVVVTYNLLCS